MSDPLPVLDDLRAESEELDRMVRGLDASLWAAATPAAGWTIAHQIAHLAWSDGAALLAATDRDAFAVVVERMAAAPDRFVGDEAEAGAVLLPAELLDRWRAGREEVQRMLRSAPAGVRYPWFGPPLSVAGVATGRLMETWAHGQDVADALGVVRAPTSRLRHVVRIGVRARDYAYAVRGLPPPGEEFRVEVTAPSGEVWTHGPEDAAQRVTGTALDFCLLVTQRAHRSDVDVRAEGPDANRWLTIAQSFAGPPGQGRAAGGRQALPGARRDEEGRSAPGGTAGGSGGVPGVPGGAGRDAARPGSGTSPPRAAAEDEAS